MHICYLSLSFKRTDPLIFDRQGQSLVQLGYQVTYIVADNSSDEFINGIKIKSIKCQSKNRIRRVLSAQVKATKLALKEKADIYQISEPSLLFVGIYLLRRGHKVIFNLREDYPRMMLTKHYIPKLLRKPFSRVLEEVMKYYLKKFDAVFCVDVSLVDQTKNGWKCNSYLLTNFPKVDKHYSLSLEQYINRPNRICYLGTIYKISRQENVFKALEKIHDADYLLAGKFWGSYKEELMNLPYWQNVEFVDGFNLSELPILYSKATISNVLRDFSETGTPRGSLGVIKIFESMERALPILCSDVPLYRDIIDKYHCGIYVDPNDHIAISDAIRFLISNKHIAYQMGQNGRQAVLKEYNWENQARNYEQVIKQISK